MVEPAMNYQTLVRDLAQVQLQADTLREQAMGVGGCHALGKLGLDEAELVDLIARVQAMAARAALWGREPVAFLPGPQRRGRDVEHPGHRADAVDGSAGHGRTIAGPSSWHKPEPLSTRKNLFSMYASAS